MQNYAVWSVWEDGLISGPHNHLLLARQHIAHQLITHALFMWCTQFISLRAKNSVDDDDLLGQKWVLLLLMLMVGNILLMVLNKIWVQSFCIYLKCEWVWYFGCRKKKSHTHDYNNNWWKLSTLFNYNAVRGLRLSDAHDLRCMFFFASSSLSSLFLHHFHEYIELFKMTCKHIECCNCLEATVRQIIR